MLLPITTNIENSENEESQQDVNGPPDYIQMVSDGNAETNTGPIGPEPEDEGAAIYV